MVLDLSSPILLLSVVDDPVELTLIILNDESTFVSSINVVNPVLKF